MFYVRFLKVPRIDKTAKGLSINAVIAITSDLGDDFYPEDIALRAEILRPSKPQDIKVTEVTVHAVEIYWRSGMRALPVEIPVEKSSLASPVRMYVGVTAASDGAFKCLGDASAPGELPHFVNVWSDYVSAEEGKSLAQRLVQRQIALTESSADVIRIWEETGDSISRHIWDGGLALLAWMTQNKILKSEDLGGALCRLSPSRYPSGSSMPMRTSAARRQRERAPRFNVLELGTGCGIVGIAFARLFIESKVYITDLPEVTGIVQKNLDAIPKPTTAPRGKPSSPNVSFETLDWVEPMRSSTKQRRYALVLVSDCTYNTNSIPALVNTLRALTDESPHLYVLVARKPRHGSETMFYDLMKDNGFSKTSEDSLSFPTGFGEDAITEFTVFERLSKT